MSRFGLRAISARPAYTGGGSTHQPRPVGGWNLIFPIWAKHDKGYDISRDEFFTGWWFFTLSISGERYDVPKRGLTISWGWTTARQ